MGIEPTPSAWKAEVLPLNYTRRGGGGGRIRTYEGISQQIYSLPPLAAWVPLRGHIRAGYSLWQPFECQPQVESELKGLPAKGPRHGSDTLSMNRHSGIPTGTPPRYVA